MSLPVYLPNKIRSPTFTSSGIRWPFLHLAGTDGDYFALVRLFFSRIGDDDPALRGFFLFQPAYEDAVMQRSDIHSHFFDLHLIHFKN